MPRAGTYTKSLGAVLSALLLTALLGLSLAQDAAGETTVNLADNEQFGQILTDAEGRTLYLFVNEQAEASDSDRMTEGVRSNAAPCENGCLENWPPVTAESADEVAAGEGLDSELLYVADVNGRSQLVYNGWPLYYFANDAEPGQVMGQGLGGGGNVWYVLNAEGQPVTDAGGAGMDGDGMDDADQNGNGG